MNRAGLRAASWFLVRTPPRSLERIGSDYGGWIVDPSRLGPNSVCYCAGVGEDISFDLGLIERFGCVVHAFDPTPRAIEHAGRVAGRALRYRFFPLGLWSTDETLRFYAPKDPRHVSHSIVNLQSTDTYFEAPCRRLSHIMKDLGHARLDLLKLDIEGAEWAVLDSMLEDRVDVGMLCVEFDQPCSMTRMLGTVLALRKHGLRWVALDRLNLTFIT